MIIMMIIMNYTTWIENRGNALEHTHLSQCWQMIHSIQFIQTSEFESPWLLSCCHATGLRRNWSRITKIASFNSFVWVCTIPFPVAHYGCRTRPSDRRSSGRRLNFTPTNQKSRANFRNNNCSFTVFEAPTPCLLRRARCRHSHPRLKAGEWNVSTRRF